MFAARESKASEGGKTDGASERASKRAQAGRPADGQTDRQTDARRVGTSKGAGGAALAVGGGGAARFASEAALFFSFLPSPSSLFVCLGFP